jgi:hypothetical protein
MERALKVMKHGQILVKLDFDYDLENEGVVHVLINQIVEVGNDLWTVYPIYLGHERFVHTEKPLTAADLKAFDEQLLANRTDLNDELNESVSFVYEAADYRYLLKNDGFIGIADVKVDFNENTKRLQFYSAQHIWKDFSATTHAMELNTVFIKRMCSHYLRETQIEVTKLN